MKAVEPVHTIDLFPSLSAELLGLLKGLPRSAWDTPTACAGWSVQDLVAHLLGGRERAPTQFAPLVDDHCQCLPAPPTARRRRTCAGLGRDPSSRTLGFIADWIHHDHYYAPLRRPG
jgi:uncharacterized protein (TIGR03083 family)